MNQLLPIFPPEADYSDLDAVADALSALAPDAEPVRPIGVLGSGYYSLAVETASEFVFRLGCTEQVVGRHEKEARLLPWLQGRLPLAIPQPRWRIAPCAALPYGAIGYPKLAGRTLSADVLREIDLGRLALDLARFMQALHAVPSNEALQHGASPLETRRAELERLRANVLMILAPRVSTSCYECIVSWWDEFLTEPEMNRFEPVLIHNDLGGQNLLVDEDGRLTGVLDWEHAAGGTRRWTSGSFGCWGRMCNGPRSTRTRRSAASSIVAFRIASSATGSSISGAFRWPPGVVTNRC